VDDRINSIKSKVTTDTVVTACQQHCSVVTEVVYIVILNNYKWPSTNFVLLAVEKKVFLQNHDYILSVIKYSC